MKTEKAIKGQINKLLEHRDALLKDIKRSTDYEGTITVNSVKEITRINIAVTWLQWVLDRP